ncbi:hypothetical protein C1T17_11090 [Sphingobium sp. SCG-1]|uniref:hypothetical protein n=1 Tax=Sphingobium sp. SCG-1 TaxID=2072936 RepID=UPI000CD6A7CA|nr:hypothetical protein [Sphingobium sp. SCG-1]AUW58563.1 hypothetical protein C1T17_11090 [Sphingobium sp. SCG-1]
MSAADFEGARGLTFFDRGAAELSATVHGFRSAFRDWVAEQTDYFREIAEATLAHMPSSSQ